ncbi:MAG: glycosyltransferase [Candidatus Moranbacteria bacterium]|nr:glycosyltransferase [Candidatus Moranbacteria bacterium]
MKKIHILLKFKDGPWGGGNQFLKALKGELARMGAYENDPLKADVILFNSHHNIKELLKLKFRYPQKKFIHRIDGPIFLIRNKDLIIDKLIFKLSESIADFSIFQSNWSFKKCKELGFKNESNSIIHNAPDCSIFNNVGKTLFKNSGKIRIIATSWSGNPNKGFDAYKYLDENLDFKKYEFVFVGNSPINFKNAIHIKPLPSNDLAEELKKSDIYITASKNDPCSNSLIEALSCGLPAIVLNDGGHPELIKAGGETFTSPKDILPKIEIVSDNYETYKNNIPAYKIQNIAKEYMQVANIICDTPRSKNLTIPKYLSLYINAYSIKLRLLLKK